MSIATILPELAGTMSAALTTVALNLLNIWTETELLNKAVAVHYRLRTKTYSLMKAATA
jgi:hypothetical protein